MIHIHFAGFGNAIGCGQCWKTAGICVAAWFAIMLPVTGFFYVRKRWRRRKQIAQQRGAIQ